jgi:hypothetical protein
LRISISQRILHLQLGCFFHFRLELQRYSSISHALRRFLSRSDEVNMHIQVHLRAHGIIPHLPADPNVSAPIPDKLAGISPAVVPPAAIGGKETKEEA